MCVYLVTELQNAKIKMERTKRQIEKITAISGYFNISFLVIYRTQKIISKIIEDGNNTLSQFNLFCIFRTTYSTYEEFTFF